VNWDALGAVAELLGAVATVATLAYLAVQIRANTRAIRSSAVQAANSNIGNVASLLGQSAGNAEVVHRGLASFEALSEAEQTHFTIMLAHVFANLDAMYWDRRNDVLPREIWERELRVLRYYLSTDGGRSVWRRQRHSVSTPFFEFVRAELAEKENDLAV